VPVRYQSPDEDSARWDNFPFRAGDIVISTRSKSGTTWVQMICALLIFQSPDLPATLGEISPWLDWLGESRSNVYARLDAQTHRRFVKTHTPLDGIPIDPRATYIVVARHPLDMAVSLYHQGSNLDRARISALTGQPEVERPRAPLHEWLLGWIGADVSPLDAMDSLPGVLWHVSDAWSRRDQPNILLVHYADLLSDLDGEMRHIAGRLGIEIDVEAPAWSALVEAATFPHMRERAELLAPDAARILKDRARFFRRGESGSGRAQLSETEYAHYEARAAALAPPDVLRWLHR
jgi:hypothetical protein